MSWDEEFFNNKRKLPFDIEFPFKMFSGDLEELMREFEDRINNQIKEFPDEIPDNLVREKKQEDGSTKKEIGPFVYGYSVTIGPEGKPVIRQFGNMKNSEIKSGIGVNEVREPLVDVLESEKELTIIAEIPGVEKSDIKLTATNKELNIIVDSEKHKYSKKLSLPKRVDTKTAKSSYKNGILEVKINKIDEKEDSGTEIAIS